MFAVGVFEIGNIAATLLILRASEVLTPAHGQHRATQIALVLYTAYNLAATLISIPAGRGADRRGAVLILAAGMLAFALSYLGFALTGPSVVLLAACFVAAGIGIGCAETAEHAAVAALAPEDLRGSAFGLLAALQSIGNLIASALVGTLWTLIRPTAALLVPSALMLTALVTLCAQSASGELVVNDRL
jgi:MFS family permease